MSPERWRQVESLFHLALERPLEARPTLLSSADPEIRAEVESLLGQQTAGHIFEQPIFPGRERVVPGAMLGPYRIEVLVGEGGMGQVFRAIDTRLGRKVAIKISGREFSERSGLEAQAISALNHPHICTLYDVGPDYLVMEYLEGETLCQRIRKGRLAMTDVLRYGTQIADALAEAHSRGITHRDLKPANIMIARSGIKVLDFGLATVTGDTQIGNGAVLGTPAYMAPEQRDGKSADARTDIYALGLVLYEAATGKRAVQGQPVAIDGLPDKFAHVVEGCLAQEPDDRWQSIRDVKAELEWAAKSQALAPATLPGGRYAFLIAGAFLVLIGAIAVLPHSGPKAPSSQTTRFTIAGPGTSSAFPFFDMLAVSPDGRQVAFSMGSSDGQRRLVLRAFNALETRELAGTEGGYAPFWSPDSRDLGFFSAGNLKRIAISGGPAQVLSDAELGWGGSWNKDNLILFASGRQSATVRRVLAVGGPAESATILNVANGEQSHTWPQFLPDGKHFLVFVRSAKPQIEGIYVGQLGLNGLQRLMNTENYGLYAQPGYLLFMREHSLMAQGFDTNRLRLDGAPSLIASGVETALYNPSSGYVKMAIYSAGGAAVVFRNSPSGPGAAAYWFSRDGAAPQRMSGETGEVTGPAISPDGKTIAYSKGEQASRRRDIWFYDVQRSATSRFTFDPADDINPTWSPDGRHIAFTSDRKGVRNIYVKDSSGAAAEELLLETGYEKNVEAWSPDGRFILFNQVTPNHERELWAVAAAGGSEPFAVVAEAKAVRKGAFSPDGRYLAYVSGESGQDEVYVRHFLQGVGKWQLTRQGGLDPRWSRDGRDLFYIKGHVFVAVHVDLSADGFRAGLPHELFKFLPVGIGRNSCDVTPDASRFVCVTEADAAEPSPLTVVLNWSLSIEHLRPEPGIAKPESSFLNR